jgi:hypothetical protein
MFFPLQPNKPSEWCANVFNNKIRATDVFRLFYFLLLCATSTNYNVHTSALDGAGKSQTEYFDTNYKLILTPPLIKII